MERPQHRATHAHDFAAWEDEVNPGATREDIVVVLRGHAIRSRARRARAVDHLVVIGCAVLTIGFWWVVSVGLWAVFGPVIT